MTERMTDLLEITGLAKSFAGKPVLRDVGFAVAAGSLAAILGASGSGKTTLLRLIAGFEQPDAGEIRLGGTLIACAKLCLKPEQRGIGYVAQEGALFPHLSVANNITFGLPRAQRRARHRVTELLALTGLPASYADRAPASLSGGEQQRVALARALAPNPRLVLLDEPFSALDAGLREETREAVAAALRGAGATAILVTHDQAEAMSMGARVGVLQDGTLKQIATPEALYRLPADAALANFVGDAVFAPGIAANGMVETALGFLHLTPNAPLGAVNVMIRPEQIKIFSTASPGGTAATIEQVTFHGHDASVRLSMKNALVTGVTARVFSHSLPDIGSDVWLRVEGDVVAYPASAKIQPQTVD
jgi:iron(III) transport system ATP-binding protein